MSLQREIPQPHGRGITDDEGTGVMGLDEQLWLHNAAGKLQNVSLAVHGHVVQVDVRPQQLRRFYLPLAERVVHLAALLERRVVVGIAGVPGSGKSTFAAILRIVLRSRPLSPPTVVCASIDGYHWPDDYLRRMHVIDEQGQRVVLYSRKGSVWSFDVGRLRRDLQCVRDTNEPLYLPAYSRRRHAPVERAILVPPDAIMLFDGNYLYCRQHGWERVAELFDLRLFLTIPGHVAQASVIERHIAGGKSRAAAVDAWNRNDRLNARLVLSSAEQADLTVNLGAGHIIESIVDKSA